MPKKSKIAFERHLNAQYSDIFGLSQAIDNFIYLTVKGRAGGNTTESNIHEAYNNHALGTLLRKYDPIAFNTGFNDWDGK